jgi:AmmeMemoRadiSam system protein A
MSAAALRIQPQPAWGAADATDLGPVLLAIARSAIAGELGLPDGEPMRHAALWHPAATFVTLQQRGELRGCVGTLEALRPLGVDVRENALAAAFCDPRFAPLAAAEFEQITVEVSLLSDGEPLDVAGEEDLVARLRVGRDGLTIRYGRHRATFLPQVWEALAEPRQFLRALKRKAGLPPEFWSPEVRVSRYQVTKWTEGELGASGVRS